MRILGFELNRSQKAAPELVRPEVVEARTSLENPQTPISSEAISWMYTGQTSSGVNVNESTAITFSAVYGCVRILSETIASLPFNVYRQDGDNKAVDLTHPVQVLVHSEASEIYTSFDFRQLMMASVLLWGNAYAKIIHDKRSYRPVAFDYIHPSLIEPFLTIDGDGVKRIRYKYTPDGSVFSSIDILHIAGLGFDGVKGKSPIEISRENIGLGLAAERFGGDFYKNGASFAGTLNVPVTGMTQEAYDRLKKDWHAAHSGLGKNFSTPLLEGGTTFNPVGIPPEAAQYIQSRKFQIEEVARIYGVPLHMLANLDRSTNNNIEHQGTEFVTNTMRPWCVRWEAEYNRKLFYESEKGSNYVKFSLEGLMRGDSAARAAYYNTMVTLGILTRNEVRALEDKNPLPGLDTPLTPLNMGNIEDPKKDDTPDPEPDPDKVEEKSQTIHIKLN